MPDNQFKLDRLYLAALVQVRRLERSGETGLDDIAGEILAELGIDLAAFADYFEAHKEDLKRTIEWIGV
jgi:hypothetical protein